MEIKQIVGEMKELSADLVQIQTTGILEDVCSRLVEGKRSEARQVAQDNWDTLEYEYYALSQGTGEIDIDATSKGKLYKLADLIEKAQSWLIHTVDAHPDSLGGPHMALSIDMSLDRGQRAYPALLKEILIKESRGKAVEPFFEYLEKQKRLPE